MNGVSSLKKNNGAWVSLSPFTKIVIKIFGIVYLIDFVIKFVQISSQ